MEHLGLVSVLRVERLGLEGWPSRSCDLTSCGHPWFYRLFTVYTVVKCKDSVINHRWQVITHTCTVHFRIHLPFGTSHHCHLPNCLLRWSVSVVSRACYVFCVEDSCKLYKLWRLIVCVCTSKLSNTRQQMYSTAVMLCGCWFECTRWLFSRLIFAVLVWLSFSLLYCEPWLGVMWWCNGPEIRGCGFASRPFCLL